MLFIICVYFSASLHKSSIRNNKHYFTCNHDHEFVSSLRQNPPHKLIKKNNPKIYTKEEIEGEVQIRKSIRVKMGLDGLDYEGVDTLTCKKAGDTVEYDDNKITCRQEDILDSAKKKVIRETMINAESYISKLVNVTRLEVPINIKEVKDEVKWNYNDDKCMIKDCDLYIFVLPRPYGETSSTLASASARRYNENDTYPLSYKRPIIGKININVAKLPSSSQNFDSGDRQFFVTCMHELMHVLAFANGLFPLWINRTNGTKYEEEKFNFQFKNNYDITQSFISSPKLTEWVHERFQVVNSELERFGIELEDGGGKGTAGSHPNSRLYFTDIMQGKTYGPGYFSPIFFYSLYDSGWYEPNYDLMEQLLYLDPRYVSEPISQYILTEPPRESFPKELFCDNNYQAYCYYDFTYKAVCDTKSYKEILEMKEVNQYKDNENFTTWYGGPDNRYSDEENFDFMPVLFPSGDSNCRNPLAPQESEDVANMQKRMEETYSTSSVCLLTTIWKQSLTQFSLQKNAGCYKARCGEDNKLRITLPNTPEQVCLRENQKIYKKGSTKYALCPNVEAACINFPNKSSMVAIQSAIPDRGPYNGHNYISLLGIGLKNHNITKITFGFISNKEPRVVNEGDYTKVIDFGKNEFMEYTNERILIKMPDNLNVDKKSIGVPIDLIFSTDDPVDVNFVEEIYTFLKRDYSNPK